MTIDTLRHRLTGAVVQPGDDAYASLRSGFNLALTPTPALIVEAWDAEDVAAAVRHAAEVGLPVAVQATGHGLADTMDGALLVHTAQLDECVVHAGERWARVGAGVRWQQVIDAAAPHGLAPICGSAPSVGVVGYTTGGGLGPIGRTYGWSSDRVRAVEMVTGDGVRRRVTPTEEPDLFWAVRGGKGAAGIVTAMEFDLVELPSLYAGALFYTETAPADVLHTWRAWSSTLPAEATTSLAFMQLPPMPGVPEPLAGRFSVAVRFAWTGPTGQGIELLAPMRDLKPALDGVAEMPFTKIGMVHNDPSDPMPVYEETDLLRAFPAEAADALLAVAGPASGSPQVIVELRQLGGALAADPEHPSALCHRDAAFTLATIGVLAPPIAAAVREHAGRVRAAMAPWATGGALANLAAGTGEERLSRSYDPPTLARLTEIAERYDPAGVFRTGQVPIRSPR